MGYNPIGIGWGNNLHVKDNFIYLRGFAPSMRSQEYNRKSAVAGMRVTNYYSDPLENMLFEDNVIVLKAEDGCTQARGIWTSNNVNDRNFVYRRNTVKVEAMPGNLKNPDGPQKGAYYNDDVNNAITAVTFSGGLKYEEETLSDPIIFEDNRLIGNVNLLTVGEGYGICNSVWMYRTKMEKINHDTEYFHPVRLGFWYWDTWNNRMIDTEHTGISESEIIPYFYGGAGKMEMRYGESKTLTVNDNTGMPLANKRITLTASEDDYVQTLQTDGSGRVTFSLFTVRHFKIGNSQEYGGIAGVPAQTDYRQYVFNIAGYKQHTVSLAQLKNTETIVLDRN